MEAMDDAPETRISPGEVSRLLAEHRRGDRAALDRLLPLVYDELRRLAASYLRRERGNHTLQPTALVHEAYLRLADQRDVEWQNRSHFFGVAAHLMRLILVDHARARSADKRGGDAVRIPLDDVVQAAEEHDTDILALDEALSTLALRDAQQVRVVELRYFGGLNVEETAEILGVSSATVKRDWAVARMWLRRELTREGRGTA
jgi:RNA polymerase sigma factor (TIGR02999 family)